MRNIFLAASAVALTAAAPAFPDRNGKGVVDAANVIPAAEELALNNKIVGWNKATQHQLVVATVPTLQGYDIKDYGYQLLRNWQLGRKGVDDGVVLLLAPAERKVRIEVGYGLEPKLTDALTSQIIQSSIVPSLKAGDNVAALTAGADQIMANASVEPKVMTLVDSKPRTGWLWTLLGLTGAGGAGWFLIARKRRKEREAEKARERARYLEREQRRQSMMTDHLHQEQKRTIAAARMPRPTSVARTYRDPVEYVAPVIVPVPVYSPPPPPPPSPSYSSDWGSSSSSDSSSSSSFDSGGGSCGGGGSDASY